MREGAEDALVEAIGERVLELVNPDRGEKVLSCLPRTPPFDQLTEEERGRIEAALRGMEKRSAS